MQSARDTLRSLALCIAAFCALAPPPSRADDVTDPASLSDATLLAEPAAATPGVPFTIAVRMRVPAGWHVSWRNPGDAGLAPTLRWELPPEMVAGPIQWPVPHEAKLGPVTTYALDGEVWLLVELLPTRSLDESVPLELVTTLDWLVCKELCIPQKARLSLSLPVSETQSPPGPDAAGFLAARARLPRDLGWNASFKSEDSALELSIATGVLPLPGARVHFFPFEPGAVEAAAAQAFEPRPDGLSLTLERPKNARGELKQLAGILVVQGSDERDLVAAEISTAPSPGTSGSAMPIWLAIICAFAGGILLNLMPCVLPVLGFKVLSLVRDASQGKRRARIGGLAYSAGIILSFWILAGALFALRASGRGLGWGFQLQSPAVVSLLALLFFALGLAFLGFFEVGFSIQSRAGAIKFSASGWGAFASGVLATAIATPCTAPFMGVALGVALVSSPLIALLIFTALGLGMAWPYALLSMWPRLLAQVPKPGPWMQRLQQALAFPLFATVLWLLSVLGLLAGSHRVVIALGSMLVLAFALWIWRASSALESTPAQRKIAGLSSATLIVLGALAALSPSLLRGIDPADLAPAPESTARAPGDATATVTEVAWVEWSADRYAQLRAEKRTVFVDFTAAWCISCQVNERLIFSSPEVRARFAALGVVPLRADWTRTDPKIARGLESFGRSGVPLNLVAGPRKSDPVVLPAVLTPGMVLDALDAAGGTLAARP